MSPEPPATVSTAQTLRRLVWEVYLPWSSAALGRGMLSTRKVVEVEVTLVVLA